MRDRDSKQSRREFLRRSSLIAGASLAGTSLSGLIACGGEPTEPQGASSRASTSAMPSRRGGYFRFTDFLEDVDEGDFLNGAVDGRAVVERTIAAAAAWRAPILAPEACDILMATRNWTNYFAALAPGVEIIGPVSGDQTRFKFASLAPGQVGFLLGAGKSMALRRIGLRIVDDVMVDSANAVVLQDNENAEIDGVVIENSGWRYGMIAVNSVRPRFRGCKVRGTWAHNIEINGTEYAEIEDCELLNAAKSGVGCNIETYYIRGARKQIGLTVRRCLLDGGQENIGMYGCESTTVEDTVMRNATERGIHTSKDGAGPLSTNGRFRRNTIDGAAASLWIGGTGHHFVDTTVNYGSWHSLVLDQSSAGVVFDGFTGANPTNATGGHVAVLGSACRFRRFSVTNQGNDPANPGRTGLLVYGDDHMIDSISVTDTRNLKEVVEAVAWERGAKRNTVISTVGGTTTAVANRSGNSSNAGPLRRTA